MVETAYRREDLSRLVEKSTAALQEMERRLQALQGQLADLLGRATQAPLPGPAAAAALAPEKEAARLPAAAIPGFAALHALGGAQSPFGVGVPFFGPPFTSAAYVPGFNEEVRTAQELRTMPPVARLPSVSLVDEGEAFTVQVEMPGVRKEDLDLMVAERAITVSGASKVEIGDGSLLLAERPPVLFRRSIALPVDVHTTESKAQLKDGVLTVRVRKKVPTEGPRRPDLAYG